MKWTRHETYREYRAGEFVITWVNSRKYEGQSHAWALFESGKRVSEYATLRTAKQAAKEMNK